MFDNKIGRLNGVQVTKQWRTRTEKKKKKEIRFFMADGGDDV